MSWATCYSGSNNIHFNYPPIMSDGRNFSSWQPEAVINARIQEQQHINTNWKYRQFLTHNGAELIKYNTMEACYDLGLSPHVTENKTPSSNVPYMYKSTFDNSAPGFGYPTSDLKNPYITREQLNARMISPTVNISQNK